MEHQEFQALQARLHKVEWALRRVVAGWVFSTLIILGLGLQARQVASQPAVIRTSGIEVVDAKGNVRTSLSIAFDGTPLIELFDTAGIRRVALSIPFNLFPVLRFFDKNKRDRLLLSIPEIEVRDAEEKVRVRLVTSTDGSPTFTLLDKRGQAIFKAP